MLKKLLIGVFLSVLILLFFTTHPKDLFAATILSTGFETGTVESWTSSGGSAIATASADLVRSGSYSLKVQHDKTSSYGFQTVISNLEPGMYYKATTYGSTPDINVSGFLIRIAWYQSTDGSGSQLSQVNDSVSASAPTTDWQLLTETVQAPNNANSAKFRLVLNSKFSGTMAYVYFDDVGFEEYTQTPSPTPAPTSAPTSTPTPTPTKTPSPTPTKTPTPNPTKTPIQTPEESPTENPTQTQTPSPGATVLGESTTKKGSILPYLLIVVGLSFLGFAGYSLYNKPSR